MRRYDFSTARDHHQELRSNLASHRNDGDKEIANANNFQTVCACIFLGNLFSGHLVPLYLVANLIVFVLDRCTWFFFFF